ncbi:hypothetical protein FSBG_00463 [Fusobacterium gonidiaformans 3-1-5R]|uniref:Uncharacterized protein n=2 Tax=Fusobacterium TaxID=848 RepID=E5BFT5_9FUSO|nr:hypothetical protein [Fusobacterium gonidiaformans]AVQ17076.1 hypothetical protein C4N16_05830 [Fusobacterium gonidiaformans ATCC 25563]EFS20966.1 hypothetical protein FSBG_00463 [Fusobacterium gonidiaformans 3-1-5R]KXA14264.1 hypothetical protein HMPREF3206_01070 [Fusobacterium equinum]
MLKSYSGSFLRQLQEEVQNILEFLIRKCAAKQTIFQQILEYVKEKYGTEVRYPFLLVLF